VFLSEHFVTGVLLEQGDLKVPEKRKKASARYNEEIKNSSKTKERLSWTIYL
jgi:hypothetical protein